MSNIIYCILLVVQEKGCVFPFISTRVCAVTIFKKRQTNDAQPRAHTAHMTHCWDFLGRTLLSRTFHGAGAAQASPIHRITYCHRALAGRNRQLCLPTNSLGWKGISPRRWVGVLTELRKLVVWVADESFCRLETCTPILPPSCHSLQGIALRTLALSRRPGMVVRITQARQSTWPSAHVSGTISSPLTHSS